VWQAVKWFFGKIFNSRNITGPFKWLMSFLFGWKILSKKERENRDLLKHLWSQQRSTTGSVAAANLASKISSHEKQSRILGVSKNIIKSIIFALAGLII
jgi:RNase P/RNase MRP subunit POP5